jgi:hypothetical protein
MGVVAKGSSTVGFEPMPSAAPQFGQNRLVSGTSLPQSWQRVDDISSGTG